MQKLLICRVSLSRTRCLSIEGKKSEPSSASLFFAHSQVGNQTLANVYFRVCLVYVRRFRLIYRSRICFCSSLASVRICIMHVVGPIRVRKQFIPRIWSSHSRFSLAARKTHVAPTLFMHGGFIYTERPWQTCEICEKGAVCALRRSLFVCILDSYRFKIFFSPRRITWELKEMQAHNLQWEPAKKIHRKRAKAWILHQVARVQHSVCGTKKQPLCHKYAYVWYQGRTDPTGLAV